MQLIEIRRTILTAIASDDQLVDLLVLKGGNALEIVHRIGERASVDLDFSLATDFDDVEDAEARIFRALGDRFDALGYIVFDKKFGPRPSDRERGNPWGGYNVEFKIISKGVARELGHEQERMQSQAEVSGPNHQRRFRIEISAFEVTDGKIEAEIDDYVCYVYSLEMIAVEKLRAICQQSPEYRQRRHPAPRARDFYDIHSAVNEGRVDLGEPPIHDLVRAVFAAKEVDLRLIPAIADQREFHRADWPSVEVSVRRKIEPFDFYFDSVVDHARKLEPLWVV